MRSKWIWIIISGLAWPAIQYAAFLARFGINIGQLTYTDALIDFGLFGLLAGWLFFFIQGRAANSKQARYARLGYLLATPLAYFFSLSGGLLFPGMIGVAIVGSIPLVIGAGLGLLLGGMGSAG
jgi:hypothetical protein